MNGQFFQVLIESRFKVDKLEAMMASIIQGLSDSVRQTTWEMDNNSKQKDKSLSQLTVFKLLIDYWNKFENSLEEFPVVHTQSQMVGSLRHGTQIPVLKSSASNVFDCTLNTQSDNESFHSDIVDYECMHDGIASENGFPCNATSKETSLISTDDLCNGRKSGMDLVITIERSPISTQAFSTISDDVDTTSKKKSIPPVQIIPGQRTITDLFVDQASKITIVIEPVERETTFQQGHSH